MKRNDNGTGATALVLFLLKELAVKSQSRRRIKGNGIATNEAGTL
ncbi:hypothetical protein [Paenibacillus sp. MER 180]|nr:hypothetical protein [Paenibacillus sp. MER 180]